MTEQERIKYNYKLMVKNNPDEAVKLLLLKDKMIVNKRRTITKAIEYMRSQYTITDDDLYLALYSSDGTLDKLENILNGKDIKEIPQFEGTLDQLEKLSIRGEDNESN